MQNNYQMAREYVRVGFRVIPCKPRSKEPLINDWPRRGTVDAKRVREWFHDHPERNLAILTGGTLFALDVDGEDGVRSLRKLTRGRKFPYTAIAETGSGGFHYLFRTDVRIATKDGFLPGLDVKGENGKIIAAPSLHPETGRRYRWITDIDVVAKAPRWLINALKAATVKIRTIPLPLGKVASVDELLTEVVERFPVLEQGTRNGVMVRLLCSLLGRGFEEDLTQEVVVQWWQHFHAVGTIKTDPKQAPKAVVNSIKAILKSGTLRPAASDGHRAKISAIELTDAQKQAVNTDHHPTETDSLHTGVTLSSSGAVLCRTDLERWFVEALIVHFSYELSKTTGNTPLRMTNGQLLDIIDARHGERLNPNELERLKRKFVAREGKPASRTELVEQTYTGSSYMGRASEFELTGLRDFLTSPDPTTQDSLHTGVTSPDEIRFVCEVVL